MQESWCFLWRYPMLHHVFSEFIISTLLNEYSSGEIGFGCLTWNYTSGEGIYIICDKSLLISYSSLYFPGAGCDSHSCLASLIVRLEIYSNLVIFNYEILKSWMLLSTTVVNSYLLMVLLIAFFFLGQFLLPIVCCLTYTFSCKIAVSHVNSDLTLRSSTIHLFLFLMRMRERNLEMLGFKQFSNCNQKMLRYSIQTLEVIQDMVYL